MDFFDVFQDCVSLVEIPDVEIGVDFYRRINPVRESSFHSELEEFCFSVGASFELLFDEVELHFGEFTITTSIADKYSAVLTIAQQMRGNMFDRKIRNLFEKKFSHFFVGSIEDILLKEGVFGVVNLVEEYEDLLDQKKRIDVGDFPSLEVDNDVVRCAIRERRAASIKNPFPQLKSKALMVTADDTDYTKFNTVEAYGRILHPTSNDLLGWSNVVLSEKGVCKTVESYCDEDAGDFDCVVSDLFKYDRFGLDDLGTNRRSSLLIDHFIGRVDKIFVKLALFSNTSVEMLKGLRFKSVCKHRLHNQEILVEVCQHVIGPDGASCTCHTYSELCKIYSKMVHSANVFRTRYGLLASKPLRRSIGLAPQNFNEFSFRKRPGRLVFGGRFKYNLFSEPLEKIVCGRVTVGQLGEVFGEMRCDIPKGSPDDVVKKILSENEFHDAIKKIVFCFKQNLWSMSKCI